MALGFGIVASLLYFFGTPFLLDLLHTTDPAVREGATSYIHWRAATIVLALIQIAILNMHLATQDAVTPSLVVLSAAGINVVLDALLCVWPWQLGGTGVAIATATSTLVCCNLLVWSLCRKGLSPTICVPTRDEFVQMMECAGPLMMLTLSRILGWVLVQRSVNGMGVESLAAFQVCVNLTILFAYFGDPITVVIGAKPFFLLSWIAAPCLTNITSFGTA